MLRVWLGVNGESKLGLAATLRLASPGSVTVRSNNLCCSVVIASQIALQSVPLGAPGRFQPRRVRCDPGAKEGSSTGSVQNSRQCSISRKDAWGRSAFQVNRHQ